MSVYFFIEFHYIIFTPLLIYTISFPPAYTLLSNFLIFIRFIFYETVFK